MVFISSYRPRVKPMPQDNPTVVSGSVPEMVLTPISATVDTQGGVESPAFFVATVADGGDDSNVGDEDNPFETYEQARDTMRGSSTKLTYIRAGTYNRTAQLSLTSADDNERWEAFPGEAPVIDMGLNTFRLFDVTGNTVAFKGLKIQNQLGTNTDGDGSTIRFTNCDGGIVESCTFDTVWNGIGAFAATNQKILGNTYNDIGWAGSYTNGNCDGWEYAGNSYTNIGISRTGSGQQSWCIAITACKDNKIEYNKADGCHSAFCRHNGLNAGDSTGNIIQHNEILNTCRTNNDYAAIYTLGRTGRGDVTNTTIQFNFIKNVGGVFFPIPWTPEGSPTPASFNFGIYLDDGSSGVTVNGNTVINAGHGQFYIHGGLDNKIVNNAGLMVEGTHASFSDEFFIRYAPDAGGPEGGMTGNVIEKNIMFSVNSSLAAVPYDASTSANKWMFISGVTDDFATLVMRNNIRFENIANHADIDTETSSVDLTEAEGDGLFVDIVNDDFNLAVGDGRTAALAEGWDEINYTKLGLLGYDRNNYL